MPEGGIANQMAPAGPMALPSFGGGAAGAIARRRANFAANGPRVRQLPPPPAPRSRRPFVPRLRVAVGLVAGSVGRRLRVVGGASVVRTSSVRRFCG